MVKNKNTKRSESERLSRILDGNFADRYHNTTSGGSFMLGLAFGAALGGAAVFFNKTEKGKKAWKKLKKQWDKSKDKMVKDGVLENAEHSLEEWLQHLGKSFSPENLKNSKFKKSKVSKTTKSSMVKIRKPAKKRKRVRKKTQNFKGT